MAISILQINNSLPIYLDLGGALAAFGLIFAVYQLRNTKWEIILKIRNFWERNIFWGLSILGLISTLISVILSSNYSPTNIIIFFQIIAYILFILSPLSLIFFAKKEKNLFTEKTAKRFYEILLQEVSKTNNQNLNIVIDIIIENFDNICHSIKNPSEPDDDYGILILEIILSDKSIVKILTTKRLDALNCIFKNIKKYNVDQRTSNLCIPRIIQNLFLDQESFLYKQLEEDGLALSFNVYKIIFGSPTIINNFEIFAYPTIDYASRKKINNEKGVKVFLKALSTALKTYFETGKIHNARRINDGLSYINDIFSDLCFKLSNTQNYEKEESESLFNIISFFNHKYFLRDIEIDKTILQKELESKQASFFSNSSVNEGLANLLYKTFEKLLYIKNEEYIHYCLHDLLYTLIHEDSVQYKEAFNKKIWEQICRNIKWKIYPAVLKTYLIGLGYFLTNEEYNGSLWIKEQTEKLKKLLYNDLKPLIDENAKMINEEKMEKVLLPENIIYQNGNFIFKFRNNKEKVIAPPSNKDSALININPSQTYV